MPGTLMKLYSCSHDKIQSGTWSGVPVMTLAIRRWTGPVAEHWVHGNTTPGGTHDRCEGNHAMTHDTYALNPLGSVRNSSTGHQLVFCQRGAGKAFGDARAYPNHTGRATASQPAEACTPSLRRLRNRTAGERRTEGLRAATAKGGARPRCSAKATPRGSWGDGHREL